MPKVAVITAAWIDTPNKVRWLREAANSIMAQSLTDLEWVIYDDYSPLELDLPQDERIRVVRGSSRQGPALGRNTAEAIARAEARFILDADDLLPDNNTLAEMYEVWARDPDKFVFGEMQMYKEGIRGKIVPFPEYSFQDSLDLAGKIPVTTMHSHDAWHDAGGWKPELKYGLEDVEFNISMGVTGHCGVKIQRITLLYRKHMQSRTQDMRRDGAAKEKEMRALIRQMHADVYRGELPMGCCGGRSGGSSRAKPLPTGSGVMRPTPLNMMEVLEQHKVWVRYNGERTAQFGIKSKFLQRHTYWIEGQGHEFQIVVQDADHFRKMGRGKDFTVGIPAPRPPEPEPEPEPEVKARTMPQPPTAEIIRFDSIAAQERGIVEEPPPLVDDYAGIQGADTGLAEMDAEIALRRERAEAAKENRLAPLDNMGIRNWENVKPQLEIETWTIPMLARAIPDELIPYPGIGAKTAQDIIEAAKKLWTF